MVKKIIRGISFALLISAIGFARADAKVYASQVRFHNAAADTVLINEILMEAKDVADPNQRVMLIAEKFIGLPYVAHTLENEGEEVLTVNLDELDCTTFVETVLALAVTAGQNRTSWRDFVNTLEDMRYRGGELKGYPSRLHYISDWIVDNTHRGNVGEVTSKFPDYRTMTKTLDYMSRNANLYPALADSTNLAGIKNFEMGYRNHRYNYLPWNIVNNKSVREKFIDGDMIAILSKANGLDITHLGFLWKDDKGMPHLMHASLKAGKVIKDDMLLFDYLKKNGIQGIRVVRLKE